MVATARTLARSNEDKKNARQADAKRQIPTPVDSRSIVARQYMRMSEAHDRIRMKILADSRMRDR